MNDQKGEWIEFVLVPEHVADRKQHIGQRVSRDRIPSVAIAHESETNSHCKRRLCERIVPPTQIEYATGGAFSNGPSSSRMGRPRRPIPRGSAPETSLARNEWG